ncbi:MAG: S-layer homology domain-containing protein, partial [Candidatus Ornithomonoglobus sp.]
MKIRKITALFTAAAVSAACMTGLTIGASAADENDLVPISSDYTYWFDDITSAGTAAVAAGMFGDDHFYSPTGNNTPSAGKGSHTIGDAKYYNSLRIKNVQDTLVFKVAEASEITFYTQNNSGRGIVITDSALGAAYADYTAAAAAVESGEALAAEPVSQTEWTVSVDGAKTLYLSSYAGDFYLAGITVTMQEAATPDPDATATPEPTQTPEPTETPTPGPTAPPIEGEINVDFTAMTKVPVYSAANGQGFTDRSDAIMPDAYRRQVAPVTAITVSAEGAKVTESTGAYLNYTSSNQYNYGGLIYRIDTGAPGAYHLEVEVTGSSADTYVAPTGMQASRLTSTSNWDNCGEVPRTVSAKWEGSKWSYDFATGESFVAIEVEPTSLPSGSAPKTVGIKSIKVTPIEKNPAGDKPTIRILGDSTQKTYSFDETISAWGQTLVNYFDTDKVNVINYSMGGRAMKSSYNEGRFAEVLIRGNEGDFVFIHSAHNDETVSTDRFERGAAVESNNLEANNENYNRWLNMYVNAIKARGMIPVLVTAMPRINSANGSFTESELKPNGFNPDSPGNMRAKAQSDDGVGLVELYAGATAYLNSLDPKEVSYIYNMIEAGETPAANSANGANGDGTHYREAASKQWCRIMLQSIYDQANADTDTYKDKAIMKQLASYMKASVQSAAQSGDWRAVFPEMASDVSTIGVEPGAVKQAESNFYYRTTIEKALELGLLHKDTDNNFKPTQTITVGEFARG